MTEETLFHEALSKPPTERAAFLDQACAGQPQLRAAVEALLAAHEASGGFLSPPVVEPGQTVDSAPGPARPGATGEFTPQPHDQLVHPTTTTAYRLKIEPGIVLAGRYTLQEKIGEGGMGEVWVAQQTEPVKRRVALKLIKTGMDSQVVLARFDQERQALALMDHPNIARVFDGGATPSGQPFFVMELVNGLPLTRFCDEAKLTPRERLELFVPICQAVQHAHQKGIVHRDLKPANILVTRIDAKPVPKVIDFGVAKATGGKLTDESFATQFGTVVGTLEYMSPEQAGFSGIDIDTRADVYSLGVILYELLTGLRPIDARRLKKAALTEMIRIIQEEEPSKPSTRLSTDESLPSLAASRHTGPKKLMALLRGELDWVVMKCLEKSRERRYETANGLARDIQRYLADEPVEARPQSARYRLGRFLRRHRAAVLAASLILVVLIGGIIGTTLGLVEARAQTQVAVQEAHAKEEARRNEAEQRQAAEQANQQAFAALKSFTDNLMGKALGNRDKLTENEKSILRNAQKQWEVFAQSKGDSPEARVIRSEGAAELALLQFKLGMNGEAEANDRAALQLRTSLATEFPAVALYRLNQGMSHQNLGASLRGNGNRAEAEAHFKKAVEVFERLAADFPDVPQYRSRQASSLIRLGNATRARESWAEAEKHYRDALVIQKKLAGENPKAATYQDDEANSHWGLAFTLRRADRPAEAEAEYRLALALKEKLAAQLPAESSYRQDSANLGRELGVLLYDGGNDEAGAKLFPRAIDTLVQLAAEFPSMPIYRSDLSRCRRDFGKVLGHLKKQVEATDQFHKAIALGEKLVADNLTVLPYQADLGLSYSFFATLLRDGGTPADSLAWYGKAIGTLTAAYERDRQVILTKNALYRCHADRARALNHLGKYADSLPDWDRSLELCPLDKRDVFRFQRVDSRLRSGQVVEAIVEVSELATIESANPAHWFNFACLYAIASVKIEGRRDEFADRAVELLKKAVARGYKDASRMAKDADLAPLRSRDDFKQLLAELEKKPAGKAERQP